MLNTKFSTQIFLIARSYFISPGLQALVPSMNTFEGAVLVADISGFTALTEQLSRNTHSAFGVELLTKCINNFFTKVRGRHKLEVALFGYGTSVWDIRPLGGA